MLNDRIVDNQMLIPSTLKSAYRIYDHDWQYFFYVVESEEGYFGYNWSAM